MWNLYAVAERMGLMNGRAVKINPCSLLLQWRMRWRLMKNFQTSEMLVRKKSSVKINCSSRQQTHNSFPCLSYVLLSYVLTSFFRDHCVSLRLTGLNCYLNMACHNLKTFAGGMRRINPAGMIFHCFPGEFSTNAALVLFAQRNLLALGKEPSCSQFSLVWFHECSYQNHYGEYRLSHLLSFMVFLLIM